MNIFYAKKLKAMTSVDFITLEGLQPEIFEIITRLTLEDPSIMGDFQYC